MLFLHEELDQTIRQQDFLKDMKSGETPLARPFVCLLNDFVNEHCKWTNSNFRAGAITEFTFDY